MDFDSLEQRLIALRNDPDFRTKLNELFSIMHETAVYKNWWNPAKSFGEQVVMQHSELSEAIEEYRAHKPFTLIYYSEEGKPEGIAAELADCIIRIGDSSEYQFIPTIEAMFQKMLYNMGRSLRHGDKVI